MCVDALELHWLWKETDNRLESLAQQVREIKNVAEAANFCRWLQFSGILKILERNPQPFPLLVDGVGLRRKVNNLTYECGECFKAGKADAKYAASDMAEINRKLDSLLAASPSALAASELPGNVVTLEQNQNAV